MSTINNATKLISTKECRPNRTSSLVSTLPNFDSSSEHTFLIYTLLPVLNWALITTTPCC